MFKCLLIAILLSFFQLLKGAYNLALSKQLIIKDFMEIIPAGYYEILIAEVISSKYALFFIIKGCESHIKPNKIGHLFIDPLKSLYKY